MPVVSGRDLIPILILSKTKKSALLEHSSSLILLQKDSFQKLKPIATYPF